MKKSRNRSIAAMIGNALEHYDMSLYGFMVPILVSVFLPEIDKLNALILTFIFTPISIIVRPLGAILIGRIGDKYGRKYALIISIGGMAIATGVIGLLPSYYIIGIWAPILFLFLRSLQGFFIAGESCGGAVFVLESNDKAKGYLSGLYGSYAVVGMLMAALVTNITTYLPQEFWRIPYLLGSVTGIIGFYMRRHVEETPKFLKNKNIESVSLKTILSKYKLLLIAVAISGLHSALYLLPVYLMNSLLPLITPFGLSTIMSINTATTILYMITLPIFGKLADKISITKSMFYAAMSLIILAYPLILLISYNSLPAIIIMKVIFSLLTSWFCAPFYAYMHSLFHTKIRYTSISLSYSIGGQLGGSMVPLTLWLWKQTQSLAAIYWILIFWGIVASIALIYSYFMMKNNLILKEDK